MSRQTSLLLAVYVVLVLTLGFVLANDYGQTWDDAQDAHYGFKVSAAYEGSQAYYEDEFHSHFGSSYYLIQYRTVILLKLLFPSWLNVHLRYFVNFITFQLGVLSIFVLLRKLFSRSISLAVSALLFSQPIIFGASLLNHKDAIFLSFFSLAMATGISMVDLITKGDRKGSTLDDKNPNTDHRPGILLPLKKDWQEAKPAQKRLFLACLFLLIIAVIGLFREELIYQPLMGAIEDAYKGDSLPIFNRIFERLAVNKDSIPLEDYLSKAERAFSSVQTFVLIILLIPLFASGKRIFIHEKTKTSAKQFSALLLAAFSLGLATSLRIVGPFAGLLVGLYLVMKSRSIKGLIILVPYWGIGYLVTYALWPALWINPIDHILETVKFMFQFPAHEVLYLGDVYASSNLPWHFFPLLLALQLTEPIVVLSLLGLLVLGLSYTGRSRTQKLLLVVVGLWFFIPFAGNVLFQFSNYDNFRHYLFALPPLFFFAGLGLEWVFNKVPRRWFQVALILLILAPGIISIVNLHPYEYIYFNQFIGGVKNAQADFELDYWCTSYKEAMEYINRQAPPNTTVFAWGPAQAAHTFARADITVFSDINVGSEPDYAIACDAALHNDSYYGEYGLEYEVSKAGAVLGRVKARPYPAEAE